MGRAVQEVVAAGSAAEPAFHGAQSQVVHTPRARESLFIQARGRNLADRHVPDGARRHKGQVDAFDFGRAGMVPRQGHVRGFKEPSPPKSPWRNIF
jgi:hypothetical protein